VAAWLAATGGALLLVAAVVVVAGNWQHIAPSVKFAGLLVCTAALGVGAERFRWTLPATARAVAHLAAALAMPVGIAAAAVTGRTWPACVLTGAVVAAVTCEVQARRWRAPLLDAAAVVAVGLGLVGVAAIAPFPAPVLAVVAAVLLLAAGREGGAGALALTAAASPILVVAAEQRIGPGTLERIGAVGDVLVWSAPLAGMFAAGVIAVVASHRNRAPVAMAAFAAAIIGFVTGLTAGGVDAVMWSCLPALTLISLETVAAIARTEPWSRTTPAIANVLAAAGATVAVVLPGIAGIAHAVTGTVPTLPLALGAAGLTMTGQRLRTRDDLLVELIVAGAGSFIVAMTAALGWPLLATSAVALAIAAGTAAALRDRLVPLSVPWAWSLAFLGAARLTADGGDRWEIVTGVVVAFALTIVTVEVALSHRSALAAHYLDRCSKLVSLAGALLVSSWLPDHRAVGFVAALAAIVLYSAVRHPSRAPTLLAASIVATGVAALTGNGQLVLADTWFGAALATMAIAAAATWLSAHNTWSAHLAAVFAVGAIPYALTAIGAASHEQALTLVIVAIVLTGSSFVLLHSGPLASAGLTASTAAAVIAATDNHYLLVSLAVAIVGLQAALEGLIRDQPDLRRSGVTLAAIATASTWYTSGANDTVLTWLAPHGVTTNDLTVVTITIIMLATGAVVARLAPLSSWATAAPGLGLAASWLSATQLTRPVDWSVPLTLITAIVAVGIGGWRRLAAPLIIGTATIAATIAISAGPQLAELDSWVWLTLGGVTLIFLAVLVERTVNRPDHGPLDWQRLRETWR
jgi:hypothetical protein